MEERWKEELKDLTEVVIRGRGDPVIQCIILADVLAQAGFVSDLDAMMVVGLSDAARALYPPLGVMPTDNEYEVRRKMRTEFRAEIRGMLVEACQGLRRKVQPD